MTKKHLVIALLLAFAIGNSIGSSSRWFPSDNRIVNRPFAKWLGAAARLGLKFLVFAEPAPEGSYNRHAPDENYVDHARSL
jgi:hypothetical protein